MENIQEPSHVLRVGRIVTVGLNLYINTSDKTLVFKRPVSLARRRKKMDGLEFLAELAPIYRVFPSLPFTLPPTFPNTHVINKTKNTCHRQTHTASPNTHVIACRKKTQTQIDIASAPIKPKNKCHRMTHTADTGTHNIHTYKTKNTAISALPFSCIFQPGVI